MTQQLGEQVKVRQQVIATASVYLRRFYARNSLGSIDPFLLVPAALFLASKVEEFGIISATKLVSLMQNIRMELPNFSASPSRVCPLSLLFPYSKSGLREGQLG